MRTFVPVTLEDFLQCEEAADSADPRYMGIQQEHPDCYVNERTIKLPPEYQGSYFDTVRRALFLRSLGIGEILIWLKKEKK